MHVNGYQVFCFVFCPHLHLLTHIINNHSWQISKRQETNDANDSKKSQRQILEKLSSVEVHLVFNCHKIPFLVLPLSASLKLHWVNKGSCQNRFEAILFFLVTVPTSAFSKRSPSPSHAPLWEDGRFTITTMQIKSAEPWNECYHMRLRERRKNTLFSCLRSVEFPPWDSEKVRARARRVCLPACLPGVWRL